ncbi:glycosyltransferase [Actinomadura sediminis]|uniref:Glycosyltransferase n=1 Tax=Actinomadura sediminis TaxID=1038904 RepID=A0ABW3EWF4_9ACTN
MTDAAALRDAPAPRPATDGVVVVMPAYREAKNLAATVEDFLTTLAALGHDHRVIVVDDGSPDTTGAVLDDLVARSGGRVIGVWHERNRGYGAAVRTGIRTALERTSMRWLLLTDSDGQFRAADLDALLTVRRHDRADAVIGYRRERADPLPRRVNGHLWTLAGRLLLGTRSRDVDCAYKLLDRRLLEGLDLVDEAAAIDPELLARIGRGHARVVEHPVEHHPRAHGEPTGASPRVIVRSFLSLARVYAELVRDGHKWRRTRALFTPSDPVLALVTLAAVLLSAGAFVHHLNLGTVLLYNDATAHLLIARRVLDSPTPGLAQLGGVWPPLPHLLALPLVWYDDLYHSGFAGSLISMASYTVTVRYLYLTASTLGRSRAAGLAAAATFALNPNVLYLQSTPMTELPLFACITVAVHHLHEWSRTGRYSRLVAASLATMLATLTRYEGWVLAAALTLVVAYISWRRWKSPAHVEAHTLFFGVVAFSGVVAWIGWSQAIFGDALYWLSGEYAKASLWVSSADENIGSPTRSGTTYAWALAHDLGLPALLAALAGLLVYAWRHRLRPAAVAPYTLLSFLPFFVYALCSGRRPMKVPELQGEFYNVRFALIMALPTALFLGYLVSAAPRRLLRLPARAALATAAVATVLAVPGTATLAEPRNWTSGDTARPAAAWLREHYDHGDLLMEGPHNETIAFRSGVPTGRIVYEGSYRLWEPALRTPAAHVRWIYARTLPGWEDRVWRRLRDDPALTRDYTLLFQDDVQRIYRRKEAP